MISIGIKGINSHEIWLNSAKVIFVKTLTFEAPPFLIIHSFAFNICDLALIILLVSGADFENKSAKAKSWSVSKLLFIFLIHLDSLLPKFLIEGITCWRQRTSE